jgi:hypothetical protein
MFKGLISKLMKKLKKSISHGAHLASLLPLQLWLSRGAFQSGIVMHALALPSAAPHGSSPSVSIAALP